MADVPASFQRAQDHQQRKLTSRYCVVIPAYNAARTIGGLVSEVIACGYPAFVIDDGSQDTTTAVATSYGAVVISHMRNQGKGTALRTGFAHVLRSRYGGVVTMDSDGQHDPSEISKLIQAGELYQAGIVIGNRMADDKAMPPARQITNRVMSRIVSSLVRQPIPYTQSGFRFIRREVLENVPLRARRFDIETELVLGASFRRWKIISVPVRTIYLQQDSHIRPFTDGVRFVRVILRHMIRMK